MGQYRALLVANSKYYADPDHLPELKAPIYDMSRLQDALVHPELGVFDREQVRLLPNARCADILITMDDFFQSADPQDTMLLYYSGHGKLDINNNFFLCAADTRLDRLMSTAVRDEQVNAMIKGSPARTFVLILDCCSSGAWKSTTELLPDALKGIGRFLLTSSRAGQNSGDAAVETESSAFTKLLVEALEQADLDTDQDGYVDIDEVYKHVEERLRVEGQQAQRDFGKSTRSVALARRPHLDPAVIVTVPAPPLVGADKPPGLMVEPEEIRLTDIEAADFPVTERVYVFNRGGGALSWDAETDNEWISLEVHDEFVKVLVSMPSVSSARGSIYIRDRDKGGVKKIPILLEVRDERSRRLEEPTNGQTGVASKRRVQEQSVARTPDQPATVEVITKAQRAALPVAVKEALGPEEAVVAIHQYGVDAWGLAERLLVVTSRRIIVAKTNGKDIFIIPYNAITGVRMKLDLNTYRKTLAIISYHSGAALMEWTVRGLSAKSPAIEYIRSQIPGSPA